MQLFVVVFLARVQVKKINAYIQVKDLAYILCHFGSISPQYMF